MGDEIRLSEAGLIDHPTAQSPATRHCLAYSRVTGDLRTFGHPQGGLLLFHPLSSGGTLVVGDPLADHSQVDLLLDRFLREHPRSSFIQCTEETAKKLQARGFYVNTFGVETDLVLDRWSPAGKRAHSLRQSYNRAERMGVKVVEITDNAEQLQLARRVSDAWLQESKQTSHELRLLTRPPVFALEPGTRKFATIHNERMVGIGFFDPLCVQDSQHGYVYQILRESPDAPEGTRTHLLLSVAEHLQAHGIKRLSLGLSPVRLANSEPLRYGAWTRRLLQLSRKWPWYNYEGQETYKSRFGGEERIVFVASRSKFALSLLWSVVVESGMAQAYWSRLLRQSWVPPVAQPQEVATSVNVVQAPVHNI